MLKGMKLIAILIMVFTLAVGVYAQDEKSNKETPVEKSITETREVEGVVTGLSRRFIAVLYGKNTESGAGLEMAFDIPEKVMIVHKRSLDDIKSGDTVKLVYEEAFKIENETKIATKRNLKQIVFLKAAEKKNESQEPLEKETIPLKGLRGG